MAFSLFPDHVLWIIAKILWAYVIFRRGDFMNPIDFVLEVDGENIPMNDFVKKILSGMISGSIGSLHGIEEDWKTLNIKLIRK